MNSVRIDVLIATYGRWRLLERSVRSLIAAAQSQTHFQIRILICIGGGDTASVEAVSRIQTDMPSADIFTVSFPERLGAAEARNRLLPHAAAEWLYFIDDDAYVGRDFFNRFYEQSTFTPHAACIGGPNLTPPASSPFQTATGIVLSSRFGAAKSRNRYTPHKLDMFLCREESLILCNLFVRARAMENRRFPVQLASNEENWLLLDLQAIGAELVYASNLAVWHERRGRLTQLISQIHIYGIGRGQVLRLRPWSCRYFHIVPALVVCFSAAALFLAPWWPLLFKLWLDFAMAYAGLLTLALIRRARAPSGISAPLFLSAPLFPLVHISYGLGILRGLNKP